MPGRPIADESLDALIVGAGPAGLTAAIYLARFRRRFTVVHDDKSRAGWIPLTRNHPGFPGGVSGPDLLARIQAQAEAYGAPVLTGRVEGLVLVDGVFEAVLAGETLRARTVLLATGVVDLTPDLPGVEDAVRDSLLRICPICDGFEVIGRRVAVIGDDARGAREALFLRTYSDAITLIHGGRPDALPADEREHLAEAGINVVEQPLSSLSFESYARDAVCMTAGEVLHFEAVYSALGVRPRSELAVQAGARLAEDGRLVVDEHQETSVPGLFAAGDMVRGLNQISTAQGEAAIAATAIHNRLGRDPYRERPHG